MDIEKVQNGYMLKGRKNKFRGLVVYDSDRKIFYYHYDEISGY
jgi:hypothetical protein